MGNCCVSDELMLLPDRKAANKALLEENSRYFLTPKTILHASEQLESSREEQ